MANMAAKPKTPQKKHRERPGYNVNAWIPAELGDAFEKYLASQSPTVKKTAAVVKAIELLLKDAGIVMG